MRKIIVILFSIVLIIMIFSKKKIVIPKDSIRFRIIANSNLDSDQMLKWNINRELIPIISDVTEQSRDINEARININKNMDDIEKVTEKYINDYKINFGQNYFPEKTYNNVVYPEGSYESLVITLGEGLGDNWWCVLFPPLCLMEAQSSDLDNITYESYIRNIIKKYL